MVSTESGAEGRNLQFCHQLINYDLPWNPMRVEQRIGRLHRLGQAHEVIIYNLSCNETIEAHVIDLLARKIRMFELVIGELDLILGNIEGDKSFEDLLREAWETATDDEDLATRIHNLGDILTQARREYDRAPPKQRPPRRRTRSLSHEFSRVARTRRAGLRVRHSCPCCRGHEWRAGQAPHAACGLRGRAVPTCAHSQNAPSSTIDTPRHVRYNRQR